MGALVVTMPSVDDATAWLSAGGAQFTSAQTSLNSGFVSDHKDPTPRSVLLDPTPVSTTTSVLDLATPATTDINIDEELPRPVKYDYSKDDFPMPEFQDIEVSQYKAPSPGSLRSPGTQPAGPNAYYTKSAGQAGGKLDMFQQQGWEWPPPGGSVGTDQNAPSLYQGNQEPRKLDTVQTVEDVNKQSLTELRIVAEEFKADALETLNEDAAQQACNVECSVSEYKAKLRQLAELRKMHLSVVNNQVEKSRDQWGVKARFYEADLQSKEIFEQVQHRIATETKKRMDEAKKEVAEQLAAHAQQMMQAKKDEIFERVDGCYDAARAKAKEESGQLFVIQQQQRDALRSEFVARMKDRTKKMQQDEYKEAVDQANNINIRVNLDDEFREYVARRH